MTFSPDRQDFFNQVGLLNTGDLGAEAVPQPSPPTTTPRRLLYAINRKVWGETMITFEARCRSGHYLAAILPMMDNHLRPEYHVLVFQHGREIYEETERSLRDAIDTAKAYLDWRTEQDFDS